MFKFKIIKKYFAVWYISARLSLSRVLVTRTASTTLIIGKFIRFFFFIYLLFILRGNLEKVAGYDYQTLLIFYLVFNFFDIVGQLFFRGIYWFRQQIISGEFDFRLVKPISPLFQVMTRETDLLDLPLLLLVVIALTHQLAQMSDVNWLLVIVAGISSLITITSIHIFVAAIGLLTTEIDSVMWIYRDLSLMARFPTDIYSEFIRGLLTFILPIVVIFTIPAKIITGSYSVQTILTSVFISLTAFFISNKFWKHSLSKYSSASS